jgi:hypothetical protein
MCNFIIDLRGITHLPEALSRGTHDSPTKGERVGADRAAMAGLASKMGIMTCVGLALTGCAGSGGETSSPSLTLPVLPSMEQIAAIGAGTADRPAGSATEVYARVALGANTCWFGAKGPLKKDYIYHAEADAPSRGGKSEITIHARDPAQPNPRGAKAYKINIEPTGEAATLATENLKMPEAFAAAMTADVGRWSKGDQGCAGTSTAAAAGWTPAAPTALANSAKPAAAAKKPKAKTAAAKPASKSQAVAAP